MAMRSRTYEFVRGFVWLTVTIDETLLRCPHLLFRYGLAFVVRQARTSSTTSLLLLNLQIIDNFIYAIYL
jgi:hypothetical protein